MPTVKIDRIEGASLRHTKSGKQATRIATVVGLTGSASQRLAQALNASNLPRIGQRHPTIADLFVSNLQATPDGPDRAIVTITYESTDQPIDANTTIEVGTSLGQESVDTELSGDAIQVSYSPSGQSADLQTQRTSVTAMRPQMTLCFSRVESQNPSAIARQYVGSVNRSRIFDCDPDTLLLSSITGQSDDSGETFFVNYEFQFAAPGWQPTVRYIDPTTNRPPSDLQAGVGSKRVVIYPRKEFSRLGL